MEVITNDIDNGFLFDWSENGESVACGFVAGGVLAFRPELVDFTGFEAGEDDDVFLIEGAVESGGASGTG